MMHHDCWDTLYELAELAAQQGEVPVAALIVHQGKVIAQAANRVEQDANACHHAEMLVIGHACELLDNKTLRQCELYVTLEPCAMCAGAIAHARIGRLYYGAYDVKAGAVDNGIRLFSQPTCHHTPEIIGGVQHARFAAQLQRFFAAKR